MNSNQKRKQILGVPFGTASAKLRKSILFNLLVKYKENVCFHCSKEILNISELSIEHKIPWMNSSNPIDLFFDLNNIAFSHLSCNCSKASKDYVNTADYRNKMSVLNQGSKNPSAKLNNDEVIEIRKLLDEGKSLKFLANKYKVASVQILKIKQNKRWTHVI